MSELNRLAQRFAHRDGSELAVIRPLALPVFKVYVRLQIEERLPLSVMHEYTLRSVLAGFSDPGRIAGLLGLTSQVAEMILIDLLHTDDLVLAYVADQGKQALQLTSKGRQTIAEAETVSPREETLAFLIDGLTRDVDIWNLHHTVKGSEVRKGGWLELPPTPRRPPELDDLPLDRLRDLVGGHNRRRLRLLEALEITKRHRLFRTDCHLLVYKTPTGDAEVEIAVGSILSRAHGEAYARAEARSKRPLLDIDLSTGPALLTREVLGEQVALVAERFEKRAQQLRADRDHAADKQQTVRDRILQLPTEVPADGLNREAIQLREQASTDEESLSSYPVRFVDVHEHRPLLLKALREARHRVVIISPWIRPDATDQEVLDLLRKAAERGVDLTIGYGLGSRHDQDEEHAIRSVRRLADQFANLRLMELGDTHAKVLIADDRFGVTTSFNWLSFRGDPHRTFRDERGTLVSHPALVNDLFNSFATRLGLPKVEVDLETRQAALVPARRWSAQDIRGIISQGEGPSLELKSSARWNYKAGQAGKEIEDTIVKTVAGFMNASGGTLLIGVDDGGDALGLDRDIEVCGNRGTDGFRNWLGMKLSDALGKPATAGLTVSIADVEGLEVCVVEVPPAERAIWAKTSRSAEGFYVRVDNSTKELLGRDPTEYIRSHFQ